MNALLLLRLLLLITQKSHVYCHAYTYEYIMARQHIIHIAIQMHNIAGTYKET